MEAISIEKKRLFKIILIFLGAMLFFTVLAKTIYSLLMPQVQVTKIQGGIVENRILATGKIGKDELLIKKKQIAIKMPEDGRVTQCFVDEEETVKKGTPLFNMVMAADPKADAEAKYNESEAAIKKQSLARQIQETRTKLERASQDILEIQARSIDADKAYEITEIESQMEEAGEAARLNKQLYDEGVGSESDWKKQEEKLELLQQKKESLLKEGQEKQKEDLRKLEEDKQALKEKLEEYEEQYALENEKIQTMVKTKKSQTVISPIEGTVYEMDMAEGASAQKGEKVLVIIPKDIAVTLSFELDPQKADQIKMNDEAEWTLKEKKHTGTVIKKTYDAEKKQIMITCNLNKEDLKELSLDSKTYEAVDVTLTNASQNYEAVVENSAIVHENQETFIYTIEKVKRTFEVKYYAHKVPVTVLKEGDLTSAIEASVSDEDQVIKRTSKPLHDNMEVGKK